MAKEKGKAAAMAGIPEFLKTPNAASQPIPAGRVRLGHLARGMDAAGKVIRESYTQWELASGTSTLHRLEPRVKLLLWLVYLVLISFITSATELAVLFAGIFGLAALAGVGIRAVYAKVLALGFFFGFLVSLPAAINLITPGEVLVPLFNTSAEWSFLGLQMPKVVGISEPGIRVVTLLTLRVMTSLSVSFLLLFTTPLSEILRALRWLRLPETVVMIIALTYKYVFLFARTLEDMHKARLSRLTGPESGPEARAWLAQGAGHLFIRTRRRCEETYDAMVARGFGQEQPAVAGRVGQRGPSARDLALGAALLVPAALWALRHL